MNPSREDPRPISLWAAVVSAGIATLGIAALGVAAVVSSRFTLFGTGIGIMLLGYAALMGAGVWLGWRRHQLARGLLVAPALLNAAIAASLFEAGDTVQSIGAAIAIAICLATVVAAVLPSTRAALGGR